MAIEFIGIESILYFISSGSRDEDVVKCCGRFLNILSDMALSKKTGSALRKADEAVRSIAIGNDGPLSQRVLDLLEKAKRAPELSKAIEGVFCACCCKTPHDTKQKMLKCSKCKRFFYCSRECQMRDWRSRHRFECNILTSNTNLECGHLVCAYEKRSA